MRLLDKFLWPLVRLFLFQYEYLSQFLSVTLPLQLTNGMNLLYLWLTQCRICDNWFPSHRDTFTVPHNETRMWANAQRDGRPAKRRWRPLFNAAKFGWRSLLDCRAGNGRFPDNHFPGQTFPGQDFSRKRRFPDKTIPGQDVSRTRRFPDKTFPGQLRALTRRLFPVQDVSRTIIFPDRRFPDRRFPDNLYKYFWILWNVHAAR